MTTREAIIQQIQMKYQRGQFLRPRPETKLYKNAEAVFGSWDEAVRSAMEERVKKEIQEQYQRGESLWSQKNRSLFKKAKRTFGTWGEAVRAAMGEQIIHQILTKHQHGESLRPFNQEKPLYDAARRSFGSWEEALKVAGLYPCGVGTWNKQKVIEGIRDRYERGESLRPRDLEERLYRAARRLFGSWSVALQASGLNTDVMRMNMKWNEHTVVQAIQALRNQGIPLNRTSVTKQHENVVTAARRQFGSWAQAVRQAGCEPEQRS